MVELVAECTVLELIFAGAFPAGPPCPAFTRLLFPNPEVAS